MSGIVPIGQIEMLLDWQGDTPKEAPKEHDRKPRLTVGGQTCECASCGLFFAGVTGFDRHQVLDESKADYDVRCRTPKELREIGLQENKYGVWLTGQSKKSLAEGGQA